MLAMNRRHLLTFLLAAWFVYTFDTHNKEIKFKGPYKALSDCKKDADFLNQNRAPGEKGYWCAEG